MLKVIIADDEERICKLIQLLGPWQDLGLNPCAIASNGIEALELIEQYKPDILVTDIRMPGCDGLTLIARAKLLQPNLEIIVISGYAHFEYARTSIQYGVSDYLLKPINRQQLADALEKCANRCRDRRSADLEREQLIKSKGNLTRLRSNLVRDLMDHQLTHVTAEKLDQIYHYYVEAQEVIQVAMIKFCSSGTKQSAKTLELLQQRTQEIFRREMGSYCHDLFLDFRDEDGYGIMSFPVQQKQQLRKSIRTFQRELESERELFGAVQICISLGTPESVENLNTSFENARIMMLERLIEGSGRILETIPEASELPSQAILDRYSRSILQAVEVLNPDAAWNALEQMKAGVMGVSNVRGREIMNLVHTAAGIFTAALVVDNRDSLLQDFYNQCSRCCSAAQVFEALSHLQGSLMKKVIEEKQFEESRPIRMAKQYIQEHYADAITLDEVADSIGFSGSYFSTFFKKETGSGFNQYLTGVRIEKTKDLLRNSDNPVTEICRMVGYSDLKHFNRIFHREIGMTPGEYRKVYK